MEGRKSMKKVKLINLKGEEVKELKVNEIFDITPNDKVLYDAIILQQASLRQGTHSTKTGRFRVARRARLLHCHFRCP